MIIHFKYNPFFLIIVYIKLQNTIQYNQTPCICYIVAKNTNLHLDFVFQRNNKLMLKLKDQTFVVGYMLQCNVCDKYLFLKATCHDRKMTWGSFRKFQLPGCHTDPLTSQSLTQNKHASQQFGLVVTEAKGNQEIRWRPDGSNGTKCTFCVVL